MSTLEDIFSKLAISSLAVVGRAAFGAAANVAMKQVADYVASSPASISSNINTDDIRYVQERLGAKIRALSPAIDLIEMVSTRGNTSLMPVLHMCDRLRYDLGHLGTQLQEYRTLLRGTPPSSSSSSGLGRGRRLVLLSGKEKRAETQRVIGLMNRLIIQIDDLVPMVQLALTTSGTHVGFSLATAVSPSRLLQASAALVQAASNPHLTRAGPIFTLKFYTMFAASMRKSAVNFTWKEEFPKCACWIERAITNEVRYDLVMREDLRDGRYHEELEGKEDGNEPVWGRERKFEVGDVTRLYYSSNGALLDVGDEVTPVLVLKIESKGSRENGRLQGGERTEMPFLSMKNGSSVRERKNLDLKTEWIALEMYFGDGDDEGGDDGEDNTTITTTTTDMAEEEYDDDGSEQENQSEESIGGFGVGKSRWPMVNKDMMPLSLLEYLIRLSALEVAEQTSHLDVTDEKINLFLKEDSVSSDTLTPFTRPSSPTKQFQVFPTRPTSPPLHDPGLFFSMAERENSLMTSALRKNSDEKK